MNGDEFPVRDLVDGFMSGLQERPPHALWRDHLNLVIVFKSSGLVLDRA
jgi:hypothetical protein